MKLIVNGEHHEHAGAGTLADLLAEMRASPDRVAVTINDCIVDRKAFPTAALHEGDRVEIMIFAAGG